MISNNLESVLNISSPYQEDNVGQVPAMNQVEIEVAIQAVVHAQKQWKGTDL